MVNTSFPFECGCGTVLEFHHDGEVITCPACNQGHKCHISAFSKVLITENERLKGIIKQLITLWDLGALYEEELGRYVKDNRKEFKGE